MKQPVGLETDACANGCQICGIRIDAVAERPCRFVVVREVAPMPLVGHLHESTGQREESDDPDHGQDRRLTHRVRDSFAVHVQVWASDDPRDYSITRPQCYAENSKQVSQLRKGHRQSKVYCCLLRHRSELAIRRPLSGHEEAHRRQA